VNELVEEAGAGLARMIASTPFSLPVVIAQDAPTLILLLAL